MEEQTDSHVREGAYLALITAMCCETSEIGDSEPFHNYDTSGNDLLFYCMAEINNLMGRIHERNENTLGGGGGGGGGLI